MGHFKVECYGKKSVFYHFDLRVHLKGYFAITYKIDP